MEQPNTSPDERRASTLRGEFDRDLIRIHPCRASDADGVMDAGLRAKMNLNMPALAQAAGRPQTIRVLLDQGSQRKLTRCLQPGERPSGDRDQQRSPRTHRMNLPIRKAHGSGGLLRRLPTLL